VTFHRKVKSSGYGFVQPPVRLGHAKPAPMRVAPRPSAPAAAGFGGAGGRAYPVACPPPVEPQPRNALPGGAPLHNGAVVRLAYSGDAGRLLTASADKTARVLKLPLARFGGEGTSLVGHNGGLNSASWSHSGGWVLTASADRCAHGMAARWVGSRPPP